MREIKFRAWNSVDKEMMYDVCLSSDGAVIILEYGNFVGTYPKDQVIPLQYTGLKDSDGKEIYADDILEVKDSNGVICRTVVEHIEGAFRVDKWYPKEPTSVEHVNYTGEWEQVEIDIEDYEFLGVVLQHHLEFKVVGNIFQDGDLLDSEISKADRD